LSLLYLLKGYPPINGQVVFLRKNSQKSPPFPLRFTID